MNWAHDIAYFFGGVFLVNSVPHLVSGLTGRAFQTPFAKPPGKGYSSSTVNFFWGFFNLAVAYILLARIGAFTLQATDNVVAAALGGLLIGTALARAFGEIHGGKAPPRS